VGRLSGEITLNSASRAGVVADTGTLGPTVVALLDCCQAALDPPPLRVLVNPGLEVSWDDCCAGQLWVRVQTLEALAPPALGAKLGRPCDRLWLATLGVGIIRCVTTIDNQGAVVGGAVLTGEAMQVLDDQAALAEAIQCCTGPGLQPGSVPTLLRWDALGPDGGCAGGEWTVNMRVRTNNCPDPP
jgi:hypothetical protein